MGPVLPLGVPPLLRDIAYVPEAPVDQPVVVVDAKSKLSEARGVRLFGDGDGGGGQQVMHDEAVAHDGHAEQVPQRFKQWDRERP